MKKTAKRLSITLLVIVAGWLLLTVWVEQKGPEHQFELNKEGNGKSALIVYDPDPIYNLDEQVCRAFGEGLAFNHWRVTVASVRAAEKLEVQAFQLVVVCSNTYNWQPDFAVTGFIESRSPWNRKDVVAITLGSGSTESSQARFEKVIRESGARLIDSKSLWLMRPNDESRLEEKNPQVARDIAYKWALYISHRDSLAASSPHESSRY